LPQGPRRTVGLGASLSFYVSQGESVASGATATALCGPSEMNFKVEETAAWQIRHNPMRLWPHSRIPWEMVRGRAGAKT